MSITDKRVVLKRIDKVAEVVAKDISDSRRGGEKYAAGLSSEGFAGGYLAALRDVEAALRHGYPSDHHGYWRRAEWSPTHDQ
jgi:hypothetical protein